MPGATDDQLRAGLVAGREDAFANLYDRFAGPLFRVAWALLHSRPDAEDAVQEVFLGLVRSRAKLALVEEFGPYLFSCLRHAVARLAARRKSEPLPDDPPARDASASETIDAELWGQLEQGLAALPLAQREVLSLKIDGGLTFAEIAAVLGIRPNTAASRFRYALDKLRAALEAGRNEPRTTAPRPA